MSGTESSTKPSRPSPLLLPKHQQCFPYSPTLRELEVVTVVSAYRVEKASYRVSSRPPCNDMVPHITHDSLGIASPAEVHVNSTTALPPKVPVSIQTRRSSIESLWILGFPLRSTAVYIAPDSVHTARHNERLCPSAWLTLRFVPASQR